MTEETPTDLNRPQPIKIALGETLPMDVTAVEEVAPNRFKTTLKDDEGDTSVLYLDVKLPLGKAQIKISHLGGFPK